ncbi:MULTISPECIES: recombinase family protein [Saccharothrix]|uniref:recombinase family protein n=1 Tax=Saccharothrix TaxID=2071 RepID=UPI000A503F9C|nr:recombinase family protein [Saccharothrix sp. CB00851]
MAVENDHDLLDAWLGEKQRRGKRRRSRDPHVHRGLRFAFYGRMSTSEYQDRHSSRLWQLEVCERLVAGHGTVVAEFFDEGSSRCHRWSNRPEAARLLKALAEERGFDAIVVGEYERAFCGRQFDELVPLLRAGGVQVWLPEVGGRVDLDDGEHRRLMTFLGAQSEREVIRARNRALASMKAQAELGRYLGGRPLRVHAGRRRPASQARRRPLGAAGTEVGAGSADRRAREVDVRPPVEGCVGGRDRAGPQRAWCAVPVGCGPGARSAPFE